MPERPLFFIYLGGREVGSATDMRQAEGLAEQIARKAKRPVEVKGLTHLATITPVGQDEGS